MPDPVTYAPTTAPVSEEYTRRAPNVSLDQVSGGWRTLVALTQEDGTLSSA